jgi:hypothetical protein
MFIFSGFESGCGDGTIPRGFHRCLDTVLIRSRSFPSVFFLIQKLYNLCSWKTSLNSGIRGFTQGFISRKLLRFDIVINYKVVWDCYCFHRVSNVTLSIENMYRGICFYRKSDLVSMLKNRWQNNVVAEFVNTLKWLRICLGIFVI